MVIWISFPRVQHCTILSDDFLSCEPLVVDPRYVWLMLEQTSTVQCEHMISMRIFFFEGFSCTASCTIVVSNSFDSFIEGRVALPCFMSPKHLCYINMSGACNRSQLSFLSQPKTNFCVLYFVCFAFRFNQNLHFCISHQLPYFILCTSWVLASNICDVLSWHLYLFVWQIVY